MKIINLDYKQIENLKVKCANCNFWFNYREGNFLENLNKNKNLLKFFKIKIYEAKQNRGKRKGILNFYKYGGKVKAAFDNNECMGVLIYGDYYLFPRLKNFNVYPPDKNSTFVSCIYVKPGFRNKSVGSNLLMSLEKEIITKKNKSIEIIGQKNKNNYYKGIDSLVPTRFLIKKGFYIKKNDNYFPLLRLDLKNAIKVFDLEEVLRQNVILQKEAKCIW